MKDLYTIFNPVSSKKDQCHDCLAYIPVAELYMTDNGLEVCEECLLLAED